MADPTQLRPKLKHNAVILSTDEGVIFQSDEASFRLKGPSVAQWMSALSPYLTGEYTLERLCNAFAPAQRELVVRLVETLLHKGVLKNTLPEPPGLLPEAVRHHFRQQIECIDQYVDSPLQRFKTFRESRVLLLGCGESLTWLALSLLRNGLQQIFLAPTGGAGEDVGALTSEVDRLQARGCEAGISLVTSSPESSPACLSDYELVAYCSDSAPLREVLLLNQRCVREGRPLLPAVVFAGRALLGPFVRPPDGPCWLCAQLRLSTNSDERQRAALWSALALGHAAYDQESSCFTPVARRMGSTLAFELFKLLSGALPAETEGGVMFQELDTLESYRGQLLQHPLCPVCSRRDLPTNIGQLEDLVAGKRDNELTHEELLEQSSPLLDPHLGAFQRFADGDLLQLPLKGTRLLAGSPVSPLQSRLDVTAYSVDNVLEARHTALLEAVSGYAQALPDVRAMVSASLHALAEEGKRAIAERELFTWSGALSLERTRPTQWLPAFSLFTRRLCYVPAAAVYPHSALNRSGIFERTAAGLAVATTFRELLTAGLCSALAYLALRQLVRGEGAVLELDSVALAASDPDLAFLLRSAQRFACPFAVLEVVHDSPLSVTLAHTLDASGSSILTTGFGLSGVEATKQALLDLVGQLQRFHDERARPDPRGELFPGFSPYADLVRATPGASRWQMPAATVNQLEAYVQGSGRDLLFSNTTPPDVWETNSVLSGTVLLARVAEGEAYSVPGSEGRP